MELTAGPAVPEEEILHTDEEDEEEGRDEDEDAAGRASRRRKRVYEAPTLSAYERERLSNIERNKAVLAELGLVGGLLGVSKKGAQPMPKRQELLANRSPCPSAKSSWPISHILKARVRRKLSRRPATPSCSSSFTTWLVGAMVSHHGSLLHRPTRVGQLRSFS